MTHTELEDGFNSFRSIPALKAAANNSGSYFFSAGAMRFFNSKIEGGMIHGRYFITSEQFDADSPRLYSARIVTRDMNAQPSLQIDTLGKFQGHATKASAQAAILAHYSASLEGK